MRSTPLTAKFFQSVSFNEIPLYTKSQNSFIRCFFNVFENRSRAFKTVPSKQVFTYIFDQIFMFSLYVLQERSHWWISAMGKSVFFLGSCQKCSKSTISQSACCHCGTQSRTSWRAYWSYQSNCWHRQKARLSASYLSLTGFQIQYTLCKYNRVQCKKQ